MQIPERRQPEQADDDDVVALGNEPALERLGGELEVIAYNCQDSSSIWRMAPWGPGR